MTKLGRHADSSPETAPQTRSGDASAATTRPDSLTLAGFAFLVVLTASNVVAIRFTIRELPPFWGAGTRIATASMLFFAFVLMRHLPLPRGRALGAALLYGLLQFGLGFSLAYWALLKVPAGLASIVFASVPLFTHLFARAAGLEPLRLRAVLGALAAIAGIAVMFGERAGEEIPFVYLLAATGAAACFALAPVVVKSSPRIHLAIMNAIGMSAGALVLLGLSFAAGEGAVIPRDPTTWAAQLYLALPGSIGVFVLVLSLLERWTASGVSYQSVLSPFVAIGLSWWLLGEPLTSGLFLGAVLVVAGVYMGALAPARHATRPLEPGP